MYRLHQIFGATGALHPGIKIKTGNCYRPCWMVVSWSCESTDREGGLTVHILCIFIYFFYFCFYLVPFLHCTLPSSRFAPISVLVAVSGIPSRPLFMSDGVYGVSTSSVAWSCLPSIPTHWGGGDGLNSMRVSRVQS